MNIIKKSLRFALAIVLFFLPSQICAQSLKDKAESGDKVAQYQYARSLQYWHAKEEDYQKAFMWLKKSAEQGYALAQNSLGYCYWAGQGIAKDYERAVFWYKKSAEQGHEIAQYNLGVCYENGHGVPKSDYSAFSWYKKSAEQGYKDAEYSVGKAYYQGKGTVVNNQLAVEWFNKAALQKHSGAMYYLGQCYAYGYGVTKNMAKAVEWYKESAESGDNDAEYVLALLYLEGNGVEKDSIAAAEWLLNSAGGGLCNPNQLFLYDKVKSNQKARKKLLELSRLDNSPTQHYFLAMVGCMYEAMMDFKNAERYYKLAINQGSYLGTIKLGLMYFYISANSPQLYNSYDKLNKSEDELGLESYKYKDNSVCLEYVKTKVWTEQDNVAYWLEKAISYGLGNFSYGAMPYDLYSHLLFVYVDGVGARKNLGKAIDVVYTCLTDSTYDSTEGLWMHQEATLAIVEKKTQLHSKLFSVYNNLYKYIQENPNAKDIAKKVAYGGLGKFYFKGYGISKDYPKAFGYLSTAVKYDNCESMGLLAACYRYGRGTKINKSKDKEWTAKAEQCGDENAKKLAELRGN